MASKNGDTILSQIIALNRQFKSDGKDSLTDVYRMLGVSTAFNGSLRTYTPDIEEEREKIPDTSTNIEQQVDSLFRSCVSDLVSMVDIVATNDSGNTIAKAEVIIGGTSLGELPVPFLIYMEKRMVDWENCVAKIPTLDPAYTWSYDSNRDCYVSNPSQTIKTKKAQVPITLAAATERHPAQAQLVTEDVRVGLYTDTKFSAALPLGIKTKMLARVRELKKLFSDARELANSTRVPQIKVGQVIYDYLLEDLLTK